MQPRPMQPYLVPPGAAPGQSPQPYPGMPVPFGMAPGMMPPGMVPPGMHGMPPGMVPPGMHGMPPGMIPPGMHLMPPGMMHPPRGMVPPGMMGGMVMPPGMMIPGMLPPGSMPPMAGGGFPAPQGAPGPALLSVASAPAWSSQTIPQTTNSACVLSMTLYIGKLPPHVDDKIIQEVLELCGKIKKWNRPIDTKDQQKNFGFVTFEKGVGAMRCYRVLNGYEIDGYKLQVKAGTKETLSLLSIEKTEAAELASGSEAGEATPIVTISAAPTAAGEAPPAPKLSSELTSLDLAVKEKIDYFLQHREERANIDAVSALVSEFSGTVGNGYMAPDSAAAAAPATADVGGGEEDADLDEKDRIVQSEIEFFRSRQAQRDKEIEDQRQRRLTQRLQQLAAEQRRADELKRKEEEAAAAAAAGQSVEGAVGDKRKYENGLDDSRRGLRQRLGEIDEVKMLRRRQVLAAISGDLGDADGVSADSAESAAVAAALNAHNAPAPAKKIGLKLGTGAGSLKKSSSSLIDGNVFGEQDDGSSNKTRTIIPLDYTEDEKMAVQSLGDQASATAKSADSEKARLQRLKEIADSIPVSKVGLFGFNVDWELAESKKIAETVMRPWIIKKMIEYLGEEETVLINFIVTKLSKKCNPEELLTELTPVLDVDAEPFVMKMWRMLVFSVLKEADTIAHPH